MAKHHSEAFRKQAIEKLINRKEKTVDDIAKEVGVSNFTLYAWQRKMMMGHKSKKSDVHNADRFETLLSFYTTPESKQGEFLRSKGLTTDQISAWKQEIRNKLDAKESKTDRIKEQEQLLRITELERQIRRKDKALAETAALLVLSKKAEALWGTTSDEE